jgi:hypothetical protein
MMAIRPNEDLENRHILVIGQSGSGKTYWLKAHPWTKGAYKRVIIWDPYESHKAHYAKSLPQFGRMLSGALKSKKGFRVGLSIHPDPAAFEQFCRMVWAAADGSKETYVIVEELGDVSKPGKAGQNWGQLIRVGRKYGLILMPVTQRPQEIDKTLFTQVSRVWCGLVSAYDRPYVERNLGLTRGALESIVPGSYKHVYVHGPSVQWGGPGSKKVKL